MRTGVQTEHLPPKVPAGLDKAPGITSSRSSITTVIGCGSALGTQVPPYFIFKGQRMNADLLAGGYSDVSSTLTETGWSKAETFLKYLKEHFLKFVPAPAPVEPLMILVDGHLSHVNVPVHSCTRMGKGEQYRHLHSTSPYEPHPTAIGCRMIRSYAEDLQKIRVPQVPEIFPRVTHHSL